MSSSGSNKEAIRLQRESLDEQKRANAAQMAFMDQQLAALRRAQVSPFRAGSPPPTPGTAGADFAGMQEALLAARRFGFLDTVRGGVRFGAGFGPKARPGGREVAA